MESKKEQQIRVISLVNFESFIQNFLSAQDLRERAFLVPMRYTKPQETYEQFMARNNFPLDYRFGTDVAIQYRDFAEALSKMVDEAGLKGETESKSRIIYNLIQNARNNLR